MFFKNVLLSCPINYYNLYMIVYSVNNIKHTRKQLSGETGVESRDLTKRKSMLLNVLTPVRRTMYVSYLVVN